MSADNMITINKKTFVVKNVDAETGYGSMVGKGRSLEEAARRLWRIIRLLDNKPLWFRQVLLQVRYQPISSDRIEAFVHLQQKNVF